MNVLKQLTEDHEQLVRSEKYLLIINQFATTLINQNTVDGIIWELAKNVSLALDLYDCVIYLLDDTGQLLVQCAAYGPKSPQPYQISNPLILPLGMGIVGSVALSGKAEIVNDTSQDTRYIVDDEARLSEISVPLMFEGKLLGVINSEHPQRNFYTRDQLEILETIASMASTKLAHTKLYESLKAQAEELKTYNHRLVQFAYMASHDLRSPVFNITSLLQLLNKDHIPDEETRLYINKIEQAAHKLRINLDELIQLVTDEKLLRQQKEKLKWDTLLTSVCESIQHQIKEANATIFPDLTMPFISLPAVYLRSILLNLITNAIKYRRPEEPVVITVSSRQTNEYVCLTVSDNGKGMDLSQCQEKLFCPGERFDTSVEGRGLGLYIIKHQVDALGGYIEVDSQPGAGTTFRVYLPT